VRSTADSDKGLLAEVMAAEDASLTDLLEVRMGMECNAAALAAQRAGGRDLQLMARSIKEMKSDCDAGGLGTEADVSFHMAICYATQNPVQIYLMKRFYDFLFVGIKENLAYLYENPANILTILSQHQHIFETIKRRDPDASFDAMRKHIQFVLDFFS
jgi:GntR family transcriptional repressor for pyruvate dehydrogenase complex